MIGMRGERMRGCVERMEKEEGTAEERRRWAAMKMMICCVMRGEEDWGCCAIAV